MPVIEFDMSSLDKRNFNLIGDVQLVAMNGRHSVLLEKMVAGVLFAQIEPFTQMAVIL